MTSLAIAQPGSAPKRTEMVSVKEADWGYIIGKDPNRFDRENLIESGCRLLGLLLIICAYGQWFLPGSAFAGDVLAMKAALSFFFGACGAAIYWFASRGLQVEFHVDTTRRELRIVNRNSRDQVRLHSRITMRNVESAFLRRTRERDAPAELMLRLRDSDEVVHVATGPEAVLTGLHHRLSIDIKPVAAGLDDRIARTVSFTTSRLAS